MKGGSVMSSCRDLRWPLQLLPILAMLLVSHATQGADVPPSANPAIVDTYHWPEPPRQQDEWTPPTRGLPEKVVRAARGQGRARDTAMALHAAKPRRPGPGPVAGAGVFLGLATIRCRCFDP